MIVEGPPSKAQEDRVRHRFERRKDWELRLYYVRPAGGKDRLPAMADKTIDSSIASVESLIADGQSSAAVLIAWATFEALGRTLSPEKFSQPQTAARLVEVLAGEGIVTPSEADLLRRLGNVRNRVIHGSLNERIDPADVESFVNVLKTLRQMTKESAV